MFCPTYEAARIQTHISRVAPPASDLRFKTQPTELPQQEKNNLNYATLIYLTIIAFGQKLPLHFIISNPDGDGRIIRLVLAPRKRFELKKS